MKLKTKHDTLTKHGVLQILNLFPPNKSYESFICAGSAAIRPETANDVDIFTVGMSPVGAAYTLLDIMGLGWKMKDKGHYASNPIIDRIFETFIEGSMVQLIITQGIKTVNDLLNSFDCSCHAWAIDRDGFMTRHPKATLPGKPINFINVWDQNYSQMRKEKFEKRYAKFVVEKLVAGTTSYNQGVIPDYFKSPLPFDHFITTKAVKDKYEKLLTADDSPF